MPGGLRQLQQLAVTRGREGSFDGRDCLGAVHVRGGGNVGGGLELLEDGLGLGSEGFEDGAHGGEDGGGGRGDHEGGQGAVIEADLRGRREGGAAQALHGGQEDHLLHADVLEEAAAEGLAGLRVGGGVGERASRREWSVERKAVMVLISS